MRKVIDGQTYDTNTARLVALLEKNKEIYHLYAKRTGVYFLVYNNQVIYSGGLCDALIKIQREDLVFEPVWFKTSVFRNSMSATSDSIKRHEDVLQSSQTSVSVLLPLDLVKWVDSRGKKRTAALQDLLMSVYLENDEVN